MSNAKTKYISEEKALDKIQDLLVAGADHSVSAQSLAGLDSDMAWQIRKQLMGMDAYANHGGIAQGLAGLDSDNAWSIREAYLMVEGDLKDLVAQGLAGVDSDRAWQMRRMLLASGTGKASVAMGLTGLDSDRAWQMRKELLGADAGCKDAVAFGLAGVDSGRAWQMRQELIGDGYKDAVALSLAGIDSEKAWIVREEILRIDTADKRYVAMGLTGLDSERAWKMRECFLDTGTDQGFIARSLSGLDSERAWKMRKEFLTADVNKGDIVRGISGDNVTFVWRLSATKEKEEREIRKSMGSRTGFFFTFDPHATIQENQERVMEEGRAFSSRSTIQKNTQQNDFPRTYVVYDLETTGLDPMKDEAIEIGALLVKEGEEPIPRSWVLKPSIPVPLEASNIHGITQDDVERFGRDPIECWREFAKFTGIDQPVPPYPFVGHNITSYDNIITNRAIRDMGLTLNNVKSIDTAAIYKGLKMGAPQGKEESYEAYATRILRTRVPGLKYKLELVYSEFGGLIDDVRAHRAEDDVRMTNFVYRKMADIS